jgi:predicted cupin superfamily sugar epimerase
MIHADDIRRLLQLEPLPAEGGYYRETYRCARTVMTAAGERSALTAIYYLVTPDSFSMLHRLPGDETFHFYLGDPVEMLQLHPDGSACTIVIGPDVAAGMTPQAVVPGGVWQGTRLVFGGRFALLGTTMSPGFDPRDFEAGSRARLLESHPGERDRILALTPASPR